MRLLVEMGRERERTKWLIVRPATINTILLVLHLFTLTTMVQVMWRCGIITSMITLTTIAVPVTLLWSWELNIKFEHVFGNLKEIQMLNDLMTWANNTFSNTIDSEFKLLNMSRFLIESSHVINILFQKILRRTIHRKALWGFWPASIFKESSLGLWIYFFTVPTQFQDTTTRWCSPGKAAFVSQSPLKYYWKTSRASRRLQMCPRQAPEVRNQWFAKHFIALVHKCIENHSKS